MVTLYNTVSSDGYIARENGDEDFISDELWSDFLGVCKDYDTLIFGRKTYDAVQNYEEESLRALEDLNIKKIVVSKDRGFIPKNGYIVANSPESAISQGENILVASGPILNTYLLENSLVDKVIIYTLPISIDKGIKPFNIETKNIFISQGELVRPDGVKIGNFILKKE